MSHLSSTTELARLAALYHYEILDTPAEEEFDDFTRLAAQICGTPVALISLVDRDRQWFKSALGIDIRETPIDHAICKTTILQKEPLVVPDATLDPRFRENPLVCSSPHFRFYAGAALETRDGHALGTLCVLDFQPHEISDAQRDALAILARKVMATLELRLSRKALHDTISSISDAFIVLNGEHRIVHANEEARSLFLKPGPFPEGELIEEACDFEGSETFLTHIREAGQGDEKTFEFKHQPSGRWLAVRTYPARSGLTVSCHDVTANHEAEQQLRLLESCVAHVEDTVIITEANPIRHPGPRIVYVNEAFVRQTGYTRDEALGQTPRILQGHNTQREALDRIKKSLAAGKTIREELINYTKSGSEIWVEIEISPVADENGKATHFIAVQRDITDRKQAEIERRELVRALGERVKELHTLHQVANLLRDDANSPKQLLQAIADLIPDALQHPEAAGAKVCFGDEEAVSARFSPRARWAMKANFKTCCGMNGSVQLVYRSRQADADDGPFLKEERTLIDSVAEMLRTHFERLRAHASLLASEERFRQLAESMPIIVWTATPDGEIDYANQVFYRNVGVPPSSEISKSWMLCLHPEDREPCLEEWQYCVSTGKAYCIEYRIRFAASKEYRWIRVEAHAIRDEQGQITHWFGTGTDVHQTRQLREDAAALASSLTATLESITDAFITINRDWKITYLNREAENQLKLGDDAIGRDLKHELANILSPRFLEKLGRALTENITVAFEENFPALEKWFDIRAYPSVEGIAIYLQNVTEARRNREGIAISEERFRLLSGATNDAIWDWDLRDNSVWRNEGFIKYYGNELEETPILHERWRENLHPSDRERVDASLHAVLAGSDDFWTDEYRFRRSDGSYAHVSDRGRLIRDSEGTAVRMIGGMTDISERKQSENKLREQATLLDKAQDAILVRDLDHRILYWNQSAERLYGWTSQEALGRSIENLLYHESESFLAATEITLNTGEWIGELQQKNKAGDTLTIEGRWSLVCDDEGQPRSILSINTDITDRKRLEQQFLRAQRLESLGTLAGGIAHDLNNVLAPIVMSIDLLNLTIEDPEDREILTTIETSAKRGSEMVAQVLSFARGMGGQRIEVSINQLMEDIDHITRDTFPKNIRVETNAQPDLWCLKADPTQLHQVLLNLCVNARDAMPDGGTIAIQASNFTVDRQYAALNVEAEPGPHILIEVSDQGEGMPPQIIEKIFDPFFTTKEVGAGTGLGLSTSLAIVKSHHGFIRVESEPGSGTRFSVHLPAEPCAIAEQKKPLGKPQQHGHGETVLVVDDEKSIRHITKRTLETFGYRVLTASDGAEGFSLFVKNQKQVDVVITDVMMPVMDGPAMIKALHRIDSSLRIIAASGISAHEETIRKNHPHVTQFLAKPYNAERLLAAVHAELDTKRKTAANLKQPSPSRG